MLKYIFVSLGILLSIVFFAGRIHSQEGGENMVEVYDAFEDKVVKVPVVEKTKEEWKKELTPLEYQVMWEHGTERAFTGDLLNNKKKGIYVCRSCHNHLFSSDTKFESGTGWPSFSQPVNPHNVGETSDTSLMMHRVEIHCARCGAHLGHVFEDGPQPTGLRYCMNSTSLDFVEKK